MGLKEDLKRFEEVGEERRQDLTEFIQHGQIEAGDDINIPVKVINLPAFEYDKSDMGGVGKGEGEIGEGIGEPEKKPGEEGEEAGEETSEHGHYEMDPEEFAQELDDELGLDLDPKGKKVKEEKEGPYTQLARSGPESTLDFERMFKKGLKRSLSMFFDEDYLREVMKVEGMNEETTFQWARENNIPVSKGWIEQEYLDIEDRQKYISIDDISKEMRRSPAAKEIDSVALREEDKRHKYPKTTTEYEKNAVVVFIRDVSGSMGKEKRRLVERVFTPIDWYLTGKYDNAEFVYIAHDAEAQEVQRINFFGMKSGGGTRISSGYELAQEILENRYPWKEWNRYVLCSGDGENIWDDSEENVVPLMEDINANLHGYIEVNPDDSRGKLTYSSNNPSHLDVVEDNIGDRDNIATFNLKGEKDIMDCIYEMLSTDGEE